MKKTSMLALGLAASLLAVCRGAPLTSTTRPAYKSVVVFGDSESDNGNVYAMTKGAWPVSPPYFEGRFSNGPVWAEHFAAALGVPLRDYAYGGATTSNALVRGLTGPKSDILVPSLDDQATRYLSQGHQDIGRSLVVIWGGINDALANRSITPAQSAAVVGRLVDRLKRAGATRFIVVGSPDLSMIPWDSYIDKATRDTLYAYSAGLARQLASLAAAAGVTYAPLDPLFRSFGFYEQGWKKAGFDPHGLYGSCLQGTYTDKVPRSLCDDPDRRVFWDEYHPTRVTHQLIATTLLEVL